MVAETGTAQEWSDEEGHLWFWATMSGLSGTSK